MTTQQTTGMTRTRIGLTVTTNDTANYDENTNWTDSNDTTNYDEKTNGTDSIDTANYDENTS